MNASRRTIIGSIAAAVAGGQSAAKAVTAEMASLGAAAGASLGQAGVGLNQIPVPHNYATNPNWRAVRRLENYFEALHGARGPMVNPAVDAIKSYSPWYRAHRKASAATEPEEASATMALIRELRRVLP